jgi:hypothetical protein
VAQDPALALVGDQEAQQDAEQSAFAGPVGAQQAACAAADREVHPVQGLHGAVAEADAFELDIRFGGRCHWARPCLSF